MDKLNIKFNNPIMDQENIEKIAGKVNDVIDKTLDDNNKIEAGNLNRKLYYHGIYFQTEFAGSGTTGYCITLSLLTKDATPLTKETFLSKLTDLVNANDNVTINASGFYKTNLIEITSVGCIVGIKNSGYRIRGGQYNQINVINEVLTNEGFANIVNNASVYEDNVNEIYPNIED